MTMENDLVERLLGHVADFEDDLRQTIAAKILPDRAAYGENQEVPVSLLSAVASRIQALEAELARKTEVLGKAFRAITYPADTSIEPTGYGLRHDPDSVAYAAELLIAALVLEEKTDV